MSDSDLHRYTQDTAPIVPAKKSRPCERCGVHDAPSLHTCADEQPIVAGRIWPDTRVPIPRNQVRAWNQTLDTFWVIGREYEGQFAGQYRIKMTESGEEHIHALSTLSELSHLAVPAADEPPAPHDDEHQHGDPMAATLSDRTIEKVLSRPAHVPSIVMLERDAAAKEMASKMQNLLNCAAASAMGPNHPAVVDARQALADYRETTR